MFMLTTPLNRGQYPGQPLLHSLHPNLPTHQTAKSSTLFNSLHPWPPTRQHSLCGCATDLSVLEPLLHRSGTWLLLPWPSLGRRGILQTMARCWCSYLACPEVASISWGSRLSTVPRNRSSPFTFPDLDHTNLSTSGAWINTLSIAGTVQLTTYCTSLSFSIPIKR